jgi:heavy metal translocating P-type ATPase
MEELFVLFVAYAGVKLFNKFHKKAKTSKKKKSNRALVGVHTNTLVKENDAVQLTNTINDAVQPPTVEVFIEEASKTEKEHTHYLKASGVAIGLSAFRNLSPTLNLLSIAAVTYTTLPIFKKAEISTTQRGLGNNDALNVILISLCLATSQHFAAVLVGWFYHLGKKLVAKVQIDSKKTLINLFDQQPRSVWILKDEFEIEVPFKDIQINDVVVVNMGEAIPVDGVITEGQVMVDQHALTGESQPVEKGIGEKVFASTVVVAGKTFIKVEKTGSDTTISKIGEILSRSINTKSELQSKGEQWADQAAMPLMSIAGFFAPLLGFDSAVTILGSSFGNRIQILAPLGTLNHITVASHHGILIKDGRTLEWLNEVDTVLFDKTGTLTKEHPIVGCIFSCSDYEEYEILTYAAAAECKLVHPIAKAIVHKAKESNLILPNVEDSKYQIGYGITVGINNKVIQVGSGRFMDMEGITVPESIEQAVEYSHIEGHSVVMVAIDYKVCGTIEMQATVRPEVKDIISGLRRRGIKHIGIVSGDHQQPTRKLAESLDMDSYFYDILPENKASIIERLQKNGRSVCFIGDGINDSIAMKKAHVSISLSGASSIATDTAQIIFMTSNLTQLCNLFDVAKKLENNLKNSLYITIVPGVVNIIGAFMFDFGIMTSIVLCKGFGLAAGMYNVKLPLKEITQQNKITQTKLKNE